MDIQSRRSLRMRLAVLTISVSGVCAVTASASAQFGDDCPLYPCPTTLVGAATYATTLGDVNGDQIPDVVFGRSGGMVGMHLNDGAGHFTPGPVLAVQNQPRAVQVIDIDQDGDNDIVTANRESNSISTLLNDGLGGFGAAINSPAGSQPSAIAFGDLDGDGDLDAAVINFLSSGSLTVLRNDGDGAFSTLASVPVGNTPDSIAIGLLNNDSLPDIVVTYRNGSNGRLAIFYNEGDGTLGVPVLALEVSGLLPAVRIGDLENDGDLDIIAVGQWMIGVRLINDGFGGFKTVDAPIGAGGTSAAVLADVNGDMLPDLFTTEPSGGSSPRAIFHLLSAPGGAAFEPMQHSWGVASPDSIAVGNIDADEFTDVMVAQAGQFTYHRNDGNGSFDGENRLYAANQFLSLHPIDFDGDGLMDIIGAGGGGSFSTMRNNGNLDFGPPVPYMVSGAGAAFRSMTLSDMDSDGDADVVYLQTNRLYIVYNSGSAVFGPSTEFLINDGNGIIASADFDADDDMDVVYSNPGAGLSGSTITLMKNDGAGGFEPPVIIPSGTTPQTIVTGDMDNDGDVDMIVANLGYFNGTAAVSVFRNDGFGNFEPPIVSPLDGRPGDVAVGDLDGDGDLDVVAALSVQLGGGLDQRISVLINAGDGTLDTPATINVGIIPNKLVIRDVNGDARPDVIVIGQNSSLASILINKGQGGFHVARHNIMPSPISIVVEDFTGDSLPDILIAHQSGNFLGLLQHQAQFTAIIQQPMSQTISAGENATFSVSALPAKGVDFQWFRNDLPLRDGGNISGATTATLLIATAAASDTGSYRVRLVQSACLLASHAADLIVVSDCPSDINSDGNVNVTDLLTVITNWGATGPNVADVNGDLIVDVSDLLAVITSWGACP